MPSLNLSPRFRLVFVLGVARCGSTLLGRLLDMHPRIFCGGEMMRTDRALATGRVCGCGERVDQCAFWKPILPMLAEVRYNYRCFTPDLYQRIARIAGADIVLDLSKSLARKRTRWWWRSDVGYIFLVRDSRGVISSSRRVGKSLKDQIAKHRKRFNRISRFARAKGARSLTVFYEDLASHPETELRRITEFLNLEFDPALLRPADQVHHFIHSSSSGYLKGSNDIRLDERWKSELSSDEQAEIVSLMESIPVLRDRYLVHSQKDLLSSGRFES